MDVDWFRLLSSPDLGLLVSAHGHCVRGYIHLQTGNSSTHVTLNGQLEIMSHLQCTRLSVPDCCTYIN